MLELMKGGIFTSVKTFKCIANTQIKDRIKGSPPTI